MEEFEGEMHTEARESRIVAGAFVAQEGVLRVDFDPLEVYARFFEAAHGF